MSHIMSRRQMLARTGLAGAGLAAGLAAKDSQAAEERPKKEPFGYCLNTSTIRGQKLTLVEEVEIAAKAGYTAIEPWIREIDQHVESGGSLVDLKKRIADHGMTVESAIGFSDWIVDNDAKRRKGLEVAKREMDVLSQIGGVRIAAPPVGATDQTDLDLLKAAKRYRALLEVGREMGVLPQVELWGFSKSLHRVGEVMFVATEAGHEDACVLLDVYHIYKGGSDFHGLKLISGAALQVLHCNDYPDKPVRSRIGDSHRVYPGDGVAPLGQIFRDIYTAGFRGHLSLELFNRDYWKQDPLTVVRTGLRKMRSEVKQAFA